MRKKQILTAILALALAGLLLFGACGTGAGAAASSEAPAQAAGAADPGGDAAGGEGPGVAPFSLPAEAFDGAADEAADAPQNPSGGFRIETPAIDDKGVLAHAYGKHGEQIEDGVATLSPPLTFADAPEGTVSYALIMDDPDSVPVVGYVCDHWLAANITAQSLAENASITAADEMVQGQNCFGQNAYGGPAPPNAPHFYVFTVYALSQSLPLENGFTRAELEAAVENCTLATAQITGAYSESAFLPANRRICGNSPGQQ